MNKRADLVFTIPTKPFDLDAALCGVPFIYVWDAARVDAADCVTTIIRLVEHPDPKHNAYAVFVGEWLIFDDLDEMNQDLLLVVADQQSKSLGGD